MEPRAYWLKFQDSESMRMPQRFYQMRIQQNQ
jgi:hypothetical protein